MAEFTIVNPYIGHGLAFVSGDGDKAGKVAEAISIALKKDSAALEGRAGHAAPANLGRTNGAPDGPVVGTKDGVTVTLFSTATDADVAAVRAAIA